MEDLKAYNKNLAVWAKRLGVRPVGPVGAEDMRGVGRKAALTHVLQERVAIDQAVAWDIAKAVYAASAPVFEWPESPLAMLILRCRKARGLGTVGRALQRRVRNPGGGRGWD